jgi:DNA-binding beta-propeller fold protein YncE
MNNPTPSIGDDRSEMWRASRAAIAITAAVVLACGSSFAPRARAQSVVLGPILELPDVQGRLDHLDIDLEGNRLFLAALGAGSLEVIDLSARGRVARITPLAEPQGVAYLAASHRLIVADGGGRVEAYDKMVSGAAATSANLDDADNVRFDATVNQLMVGSCQALTVLDPRTLRVVRKWDLAGHPEAFEIERGGRFIYVNVPSAAQIAVIDRQSDKVVASWPVTGASGNFAMALDESSHRVFVATRRPPLLIAVDTENGKRVGEIAICGDADDLFFDSRRQQLYAICGEGRVEVIRQRGADHYVVVERVQTSPGARTGLFVPGLSTLFVAVPARAGASAEIRGYTIR